MKEHTPLFTDFHAKPQYNMRRHSTLRSDRL